MGRVSGLGNLSTCNQLATDTAFSTTPVHHSVMILVCKDKGGLHALCISARYTDFLSLTCVSRTVQRWKGIFEQGKAWSPQFKDQCS